MPSLDDSRLLGEPIGRDTLNAVGFTAAILESQDPDAVIGVFTADHMIEPVDKFQRIVEEGFSLVENSPETLVTFGITPTEAATGYGYLELGSAIRGTARAVERFREKPPRDVAEKYVQMGPGRYLWNSGMFVWRAATLLDCIRRYEPEVADGLAEIARAWNTPERTEVLHSVFPTLKKTSIDFAVMEPASQDEAYRVAGIPMELEWLDVGSWPSFAGTRPQDEHGNSLAAENHLLHETKGCLVASSQPDHLVATIGCENLIVIHTERATLVCPADQAQKIKELQKLVDQRYSGRYT
jgi:mannose-1-phosphate guanylyltransferase